MIATNPCTSIIALSKDFQNSEKPEQSLADRWIDAFCPFDAARPQSIAFKSGTIDCPNDSLGVFVSSSIENRLKEGDFPGAYWLQEANTSRLSDSEIERLNAVWRSQPSSKPSRWTQIENEPSAAKLVFENNKTLRVTTDSVRVFDLENSPISLTESSQEAPTHQVLSLSRNCKGYEAQIVIDGVSKRVSLYSEPQRPPCSKDASDLAILGWAPQGLIIARKDRLGVVTIAKSTGEVSDVQWLDDPSLLPLPIDGAQISSDGETRLIPVRGGIILHRVTGGRSNWINTDSIDKSGAEIRAAALSPDASRIALQIGESIGVLQL
ncbi:MAG: hypothetical protein R3A47_04515 [Polyangiales bacterium]